MYRFVYSFFFFSISLTISSLYSLGWGSFRNEMFLWDAEIAKLFEFIVWNDAVFIGLMCNWFTSLAGVKSISCIEDWPDTFFPSSILFFIVSSWFIGDDISILIWSFFPNNGGTYSRGGRGEDIFW